MKTVEIVPFGFPPDDVIVPSHVDRKIANLRRWCLFLLAAIVANTIISFLLMPMVFINADVKAYVADGGVYGCELPTYKKIEDVKNLNKRDQ